ncbi:IS110 family transposase [Ruthenibacterium lactatiformans]|uniref:IS110 family transposase n=1 Tax=Ruthenibacterium lactatiformans TaxID=1550024 RepID=UPI0026DA7BF9|nr:IS110 family transposase [Ruthenibacterium lactatiformans]MDU5534289.1 IS110 family transposase [Oscillospiraceae bacterium]
MKVVFPTCCGVDVHKSFLVATIIKTPKDSLQPSYQKKRFSTFNSDLNQFADWLHEKDCLDVCMESTGKYWVPVFNILEKRGIRVVIANPKWVKAVKGNKDDTKDSKWIGDLFRIGLVKSSFIPAKDIRILRELTRYRYKLTSMKSSEKNRFQNAFTVCNVALDSVVSDMFGKSATAITDYLTSDEDFDPQHCVSLLHRSLKKKADDVLASIEGYEITLEQKYRIGIVRDHLHYIEKLIERVDLCINAMVEKYDGAISLLCTIPGIDRSSAITVISEIGVDMAQFGSSKRLCCWAGLTPGNNESAGKKKSVRISRAGVYLKPALVQVAHAAVKDKLNPYYALKYERIAKRRGKKRAIIAIARMILTAIYSMLSTGEIWNPVDLFKVDIPEHLKEQQLQKAVKQAVRFLEAQGLKVS